MSDQDAADEDDDAPLAIIATVKDLAKWMPPGIAPVYGSRPVWFILEMDAELVTVFEQIPEDPMPKGKVEAILQGLRAFATERNTELQTILGPTDGISYGFHVDAPLDRVVEAFEEDGFDVLEAIAEGEITFGDDDEGATEPD
jgi:hypothetical protein